LYATAQTSSGEVEAAEVTLSPALPGNGPRDQRDPLSRQATGLCEVVPNDWNTHALWGPVAVTLSKLVLGLPRTVLTIFHDAGAAVAANAAAGISTAAQAKAAAPISGLWERLGSCIVSSVSGDG
jgi:hypothetical protein